MKIQIKTGILAILVILIIVSYSYLPSRGPTLQIKPQIMPTQQEPAQTTPAAGPEATIVSTGTAPLSPTPEQPEQTPIAAIPITIQPRDYSQLGLTENQTKELESAELTLTIASYIG